MENKRLINLVKDKIISGYSDEEIHNFLIQEGLSDKRIEEILHLCLQELHLDEEEINEDEGDDNQVHNHHDIPLPGAWWLLVQSCAILKENLTRILGLALMWFVTLVGVIVAVALLGFIASALFAFMKMGALSIITIIFVFLVYFFVLLFIPTCYFISVIRLISMQSKSPIEAYIYAIKRFFPITLTAALVSFSYFTAIAFFIIIFASILFSRHLIMAGLFGIIMMVPLCAILIWYSLTSVVMANDEQYYIKAIARSREYIKGHFFGFWGRSAFISSITILILIVLALIIPGGNKKDKSFGETLSKKVFVPEDEKIVLKANYDKILNSSENLNYKKIPFESFSESDFVIEGNWVCNRYDQYDCTKYKVKSNGTKEQIKSFIDDYETIKNGLAKKAKNYKESYNQISADNFVCNRHNLYYCDKTGFPRIYGYPDDLSKEIAKSNAAVQRTLNNKLVISGDLPMADLNVGNSKLINLDFIWDIIYFIIILPIFAIYFQILYVYLSRNKSFSYDFTFSKKHKILFLILVSSPILIGILTIAFFGKILAIIAMFK